MKRTIYSCLLVLIALCGTLSAKAQTLSGSTSCVGSLLTVASSVQPSQIVWQLAGTSINTVTPTIASSATTVAGTGIGGNGANQLNNPYGVCVDAGGNIYVADLSNHRIQKWAPGATSGTTVAGTGSSGSGTNQFYQPSRVYVDAGGNIYVADQNNHRIQKWAAGATSGTRVAGTGTAGSGANQLYYATGVFVDAGSNIYVADYSNHRIQKWAPGATSGTRVAGTGSFGSGANQLNSPFGVYVDAGGNIYVADQGNHRIQKWAPGATSGATVAGTGTSGSGANQLDNPAAVYVDAGGNIHVADQNNHRIQKWVPGATSGTTVAGTGTNGSAANQLNIPTGVYVDAGGNIYVADYGNNRIQKFAASIVSTYNAATAGNYTALVTTGVSTVTTNTVTVNPLPTIGVGGNTLIYAGATTSLTANSGVSYTWSPGTGLSATTGANVTASPTSSTIYTVTGTNVCGSNTALVTVSVMPVPTLSGSTACMGSLLTVASSVQPSQIVSQLAGAGIYTVTPTISSSATTVAGTGTSGMGNNQLYYPMGVHVDASGNTFVADNGNNRVQKWAPGATSGTTVAGSTIFGSGANQFNSPTDVHIDASGNIYVADYANARIQKWAPGATSGTTVAGNGTAGSGANQLNSPAGIFVDAGGNIYVADWNNHRIQKWLPGATSGTTVAGTGTAGSGANRLSNPHDVHVDASGNIYVADYSNARVQKWVLGATSGATVAGTGIAGSGANQLNNPRAVYVDAGGNIYVADGNNHRIQKWAPGATSGTTVAGTGTAGSGANQLLFPTGICFDLSGNIYVGDQYNNRIQKFAAFIVNTYTAATAGNYTALVTTGVSTVTTNTVTVNPIPIAGTLTGSSLIGLGVSSTLSASITGGIWSSSAPGIANVGSTGVVFGVAVGTAIISYSFSNTCGTATATLVTTVINDTLVSRNWATYYGGSGSDGGLSMATDTSGNVYIAGRTTSATGIATSGAHQSTSGGGEDAFLVKFNSSGVRQWATYYGGSGDDYGNSVAIDALGNVYLAGYTSSTSSIASSGSHQTTSGGSDDAFVVKFNSAGVRQWATYYGGSSSDEGRSVVTDTSGNVYLAGYAFSTGGISTTGAHQSTKAANYDAFLVKFNNLGVRQWGTYYGGSGNDFGYSLATDVTGNVYLGGISPSTTGIATSGAHQSTYVGGDDAFLVKFNSSGVRQWATYYGGSGQDLCYSLATDVSGNVFMAGWTQSTTDIATTGAHQISHSGGSDGFLVQFNSFGVRQWATYYGGTADEKAYSIVTDAGGNVYLAGQTRSTSGIATNGVYQPAFAGGTQDDAFLVKFNGSGLRRWATYFGASGTDMGYSVSLGMTGTVNLAGFTSSTSGIAASGAHQSVHGGGGFDAFLVSFSAIGAIAGTTTICAGTNITLSNATSGGIWSSSNNSIATVGSSSGVVNGVAVGTSVISYTTSSGMATITVTISANPSTILGVSSICPGTTTTLSSSPSGGNWSSSNIAIATIGSISGVVTGVSSGSTIISYGLSTDCIVTTTVTVNPLPATITGASSVCAGSTTTLSNTTSGGTWSSSNTGIATVGSSSGVVSSVAAGNSFISFTLATGCSRTTTLTINESTSLIGTIATIAGTGISGYSGDGGTATSAQLSLPHSMIIDRLGNLIFSQEGSNCVRKITVSGIITTIAGTGIGGFSGDGGAATAAQLLTPRGIAIDVLGNIYIADENNNRIRKVNTSGIISTIAGTGTPGYNGDGGAATLAMLDNPRSVSIDALGNIYIADPVNNRIRKVNSSGIISTIAGTGSAGYSGDGSAATLAMLNNPNFVSLDNAGNLLISDLNNNRIRKIVSGIISTLAGTGTAGYSGDGGNSTSAMVNAPSSVNIDANGNILIVDRGNNLIRKINSSGTIFSIAGSGVLGFGGDGGNSNSALLNLPTGVIADSSGNIYIADERNSRIRKVTIGLPAITGTNSFCLGGTYALNNAYSGGTWSSSNTAVATIGTAGVVTGLSAGTSIISYGVGNTCNISYATKTVTVNPLPATITGASSVCVGSTTTLGNTTTGGTWSSSNTGMATVGSVSGVVSGVAAGIVTITYTLSNSCHKTTTLTVNSSAPTYGGIISTIAGTGSHGYSGDGGSATSAQFGYSYGIACDINGNIFFTDFDNIRVRKINSAGIITTVAGTGTRGYSGDGGAATAAMLGYTVDIATDSFGNIYISDMTNHLIRKINSAGIISTIAGTGVAGYGGDGGPATVSILNSPSGIIVNVDGSLVFSEFGGHRIRRINTAGVINTIAGTGTAGYSGDGSLATTALLNNPTGLVKDVNGNIYFSDYSNRRIRKINVAGIVSTFAGIGTSGFAGDGGPATSALLSLPYGLTIDSYGDLYVADVTNHRIRKINSLGIISTFAGTSSSGFSGDGGLATSAQLDQPRAVAIDISGNLLVVDFLNLRIRKVTPTLPSISGTSSICISTSTNLTNSIPGGTWLSSNTGIATIGTTGIVTGVSAGTSIISYGVGNSCNTSYVTTTVTVNPLPGTITGASSICAGSTTTLGNTTSGGTWSSANTGIVSVGSSSGVVSGVAAGIVNITYALSNGCYKTTTLTVNSSVPTYGGIISTIAGTGFSGYSGDGGPATSAQLYQPYGVAVDRLGNLYIGDRSNFRVRKVSPSGNISTIAGGGTSTSGIGPATNQRLNSLIAVTVDISGNIYIGEDDRIRKIDTNGNISTIAGTAGTTGFSGDGGQATAAAINTVFSIVIDNIGNIYFADYNNTRVRKINSSGIINTIAGTGTAGYNGDGIAATSAQLRYPTSVKVDDSGNVIIADYQNGRIRKINTVGTISTLSSAIGSPADIALDGNGNLFVADYSNRQIKQINSSGLISTVAGIGGTSGYSGDGALATAAMFNAPWTITLDNYRNLYISDVGTHTVRKVTPTLSSINGAASLCNSATTNLSNATLGGTWSSSNIGIATIGTTGVVTGVSAGTSIISYGVGNSCNTSYAIKTVTINPLPNAGSTTGASNVNAGSIIIMSNPIGGGAWFSSNNSVATVGTAGLVTGVAVGTTIISYLVANSCGVAVSTQRVVVNAFGSIACSAWISTGARGFSAGWAQHNSIAVDSSGTPYMVFMDGGNSNKATVMKYDGSSWVVVGSAGFSPGRAEWTSIALSKSGVPYVAFNDSSINKLIVMRFAGGSWVNVGGLGISSSLTAYSSLKLDSADIPYVAFWDGAYSGKATVMKFNGSSWNTVGSGGWSAGGTAGTTLAFDNSGVPFVAYQDIFNSDKATVMKFNGSSWVAVGTPGFTPGGVNYISFAIDNAGTPYVAYMDQSNGDKAAVMKYSGGSWSDVGSRGFSLGASWFNSIAFDNMSVPYVAFQDWGNGYRANVKKFTGSIWVSVGSPSFSPAYADWISLAFSKNGIPYIAYRDHANGFKASVQQLNTATLAPITGTAIICRGATTTLADITNGGIWRSSNTAIATIGSISGVVTGVSAGSAIISYSLSTDCIATTTITVNPLPTSGTITGSSTVCVGSTIGLSNSTTGGTWSSASGNVSVSGSTLTGVSAGNAVISYTVSNICGTAVATTTVTVNPLPNAGTIASASSVCVGSSIGLSNSITGGTWSSASGNVSLSGSTVTGVSAGNAVISYSVSNSCGTAVATTTITVNPLPNAGTITGASSVCVGSSIGLSNSTTGGTWSSSSSNVSVSGSTVTGVSAGTAVISYAVTNSCGTAVAITTVTVNAVPSIYAVTGGGNYCAGSSGVSIGLNNSASGISYQLIRSGSVVGTLSGTGAALDFGANTTAGTYTVLGVNSSTSCQSNMSGSASVSILPVPNAGTISGVSSVGFGATITLTPSVSGGVWSTSGTNATVSTGGVVTGVSAGVEVISYTVTNTCGSATATKTITVNTTISGITGTLTACPGGTTTLSSTPLGGTWTSSNSGVAVIGFTSGIVSGISGGTSTITYSVGGSFTTAVVTIVPPPAISGGTSVCNGQSITLSNSLTGGTWVSGNSTIASIGSTTGIVTGASGGTTNITYYVGAGCSVTTPMAVNNLSPITGPGSVCVGQTIALNDVTAGGAWSSSDVTIATVDMSTGVVTGVSAGAATITYTTPAGCIATAGITVNGSAAISGASSVCVGQTTTLTNAVSGGVWSSNNALIASIGSSTGIMTGNSSGSVTISYTTGTGCVVTMGVAINALSPITGSGTVCVGQTTPLSIVTGGGTWASSDVTVATIDMSTGVVTGVSAGAATITYTTGAGCVATTGITVNASAAISGVSSVCVGQTTSLTNTVGGGTWSSNNALIASIGSVSGIMTGNSSGSVTISYTTGAGCVVTMGVAVNALSPITGSGAVCVGQTTPLSIVTGGGTWSSSDVTVATIDMSTGVVTGVSAGAATMTYTTGAGCVATTGITVNASAAIAGPSAVCLGQTITLTNTVSGGVWSSGNTTIATVDATTGVVTGVSGGAVTLSYTTSSGCVVTKLITVNTLSPIGGPTAVCSGQTITLTDATIGGTWMSAATGIATIGSGTGLVNGVSVGSAPITYTTPAGCFTTTTITVTTVASITGPTSTCVGQSITLSNATPGGVWISGNSTVATIGSATGLVSGVGTGGVVMSYTIGGGCSAVYTVNVNAVGPISGATSVCTGQTISLSNFTTGGRWTSSDITVASVGSSTGVVTGVATGTTTISYTMPTGCVATSIITSSPVAATSGPSRVCNGQTITLINSVSGGVWTSGNTTIATVGSATGIVNGGVAGSVVISYTTGSGCRSTFNLTVATISAIGGVSSVCGSQSITLTDATTGGTWSTSNLTVATVGTTGIVIGANGGGTAIITYSLGAGCVTTKAVTVNPFAPISGLPGVCVGQTITLTDAQPGGIWSSSNPASGSIGSATGIVTGRTTGVTTISYTLGGCRATQTVNVAVLGSISGTLKTCVAQNTNLSNTGLGGLWSSSNTAIGTVIANTGAVTGVSAGTFIITYAIGTSCVAVATVTVNALDVITGPVAVCVGQTTTLSNTTPAGGTWSSGNNTIATIGSTTGIVTGVTGGALSMSFIVNGTGCRTTYNMAVNALSAITGATSVCQGSTATLTEVGLGTWSSSNTGVATIGTSTGVASGVSAGTATISFIVNITGCTATKTFTVHPADVITGSNSVCISTPITLSNSVSGGVWTSTNPTIARVGSATGIVTGLIAGPGTTITYTTPRGCRSTKLVAVGSCRYGSGIESEDGLSSSQFTLIPNPNKGEFTVKGTFASGKDEEATIEVVNMLGQVVYRAKGTATSGVLNEKVQINGTLANGMYLLNLHSDNETKVFHFVVKQ